MGIIEALFCFIIMIPVWILTVAFIIMLIPLAIPIYILVAMIWVNDKFLGRK